MYAKFKMDEISQYITQNYMGAYQNAIERLKNINNMAFKEVLIPMREW